MQLEPQKYYVTRNGQRVFVDAISSGNPFLEEVPSHPALGYIGPSVCCWRLDGSLSDEESDFDIVTEFEDFVTQTVYGLEDLDSGELASVHYLSHRQAFDACMPGYQVVEMMNVTRVG